MMNLKSLYKTLVQMQKKRPKPIVVTMLLFIVSIANAQFAVVTSADGYANVRIKPNPTAKILTSLQYNTAVLIDDIYDDANPNTNWAKVYFGQEPFCMGCSPDLSQHHATGYIHKSQLKDIEELEPVADTVFKMTLTLRPFEPSGKKITYFQDSTAIKSINDHPFFGADCGTPKTEIVYAEACLKGQEDTVYNIPMKYLWSVLHSGNYFNYYKNGDSYFAVQYLGDGACATDLVWVFDQNELKQRLMGNVY